MPSGYAAIAETHIEGIGTIDSLGRAGFNRDGTRRPNGCTSIARARRNAVRRLVNRARGRMMARGLLPRTQGWVERPALERDQPDLFDELVAKVEYNAVWVELGPSTYAARIDGTGLRSQIAEVYA